MEISKINSKGVLIKFKHATLAIDPINANGEIDLTGLKADTVLLSQTFAEDDKTADYKLFSWPGEYEFKGVSVLSMDMDPQEEDKKKRRNLFVIAADGMKLVFMNSLIRELSSDQIERIGDVDVMMVSDCAPEKVLSVTLEEVEPRGFLPLINEGEAEAFFSKMGISAPEAREKVALSSKADLVSDKVNLLLLK